MHLVVSYKDVSYKLTLRVEQGCRAVGTGGARGARAPPIFLGQRNKIYLEFCLFAWLLSVVHPLILAACYGPGTVGLSGPPPSEIRFEHMMSYRVLFRNSE